MRRTGRAGLRPRRRPPGASHHSTSRPGDAPDQGGTVATGERRDPYRSYNFLVEIDGITRAGFRECSGLDSAQDPIEYREGIDSLTMRKLPGLAKFSNVVLKWGISDDADLYQWCQKAVKGTVERK